ncbi:hypothetical protein Dimus_021105 [Dionaea muscipula]
MLNGSTFSGSLRLEGGEEMPGKNGRNEAFIPTSCAGEVERGTSVYKNQRAGGVENHGAVR